MRSCEDLNACSKKNPDYFTKILEDDLKAVVKPQYVDQLPKAVKGPDRTVEALLRARNQMDNIQEIMDVLGRHTSIVTMENSDSV